MPRRRRQTPVRSRAVQPAEPARARARTPVASPTVPDIARPFSAIAPDPRVLPPSQPLQPLPLAETRDTRSFRERVLSRRGTVGLLLFRIGGETFAAELAAVEEAVEVPALHGLPEMRGGMLGMFDLRGRMLPVFSATDALGVSLVGHSAATLVMRANGKRIGVAVEDVEDVVDADCSHLRNVPGVADADGVFLAVLQQGTKLASVIDAAALVTACLALAPDTR